MHRFYFAPEHSTGPVIFLGGQEAHHAMHVLRLRDGAEVTVLDGIGNEYVCQVTGHDRDKLQLKILRKQKHAPPPCKVTLMQALPKGKIIESIVQKATELGVARIVPLLSERVIADLDGKKGAQKAAKWQSIAVEAIKQCGAAWLPKIDAPVPPAEFLARREKPELSFLGSLQPNSHHPEVYLDRFKREKHRLPSTIDLWIGPEGDFSLEEVKAIEASGAVPITLGPRVLKVETAAIYCLSFLDYEMRRPSNSQASH